MPNIENVTVNFIVAHNRLFIRNNVFFLESCKTVNHHVVNELIRTLY